MSSSRLQSKLYDLDITIISAKHLHNSNWRQGDLKPYVSLWIEPGRRFFTKADDVGSTRPVWNERFVVPVNTSIPLHESLLSIEILHSVDNPSSPPPLIGSVQFPLKELITNSDDSSKPVQTFELRRPSGRPQGKLRVKLSLRERERPSPPPPPQDYHITPPYSPYYSSAPPPPPRDYRGYSPSPYTSHVPPTAPSPGYSPYNDPYSGYYSGYYSQPQLPGPPPSPRPFFDQGSNYGTSTGPSAPVDYSNYDQRAKGSKVGAGLGTGLAVGAVAGSLGGLALEEGLKHEEDKIAARVHPDFDGRDDYSDYRANY